MHVENDKLFDLMSKMYNEMNAGFKGVKEDINGIKQDVSELKQDVAGLKKDVKVLQTKIEVDISTKIEALQDGYKQNYETLTEIKKTVQANTEAIDEINLNLTWLKEDVNFIAGKTIRNDSKIDKISERLKSVK